MVLGDEQLLAVTQVPFTETAAGLAVKGTARTNAIGSAAAFRKLRIRVEFKLTSHLLKRLL